MKAHVRKALEANGGIATLTTTERATKAAETRWAEHRDKHSSIEFNWQQEPLSDCSEHLALLLNQYNMGARIVKDRSNVEQPGGSPPMACAICNTKIRQRPSAVYAQRDEKTGLPYNDFACSPVCNSKLQLRYAEEKRKARERQ